MAAKHLKAYSEETLAEYISYRKGEVKLGESLTCFSGLFSADTLSRHSQDFVIVGLREDLGVQANLGNPGASEGFEAFLSHFLNIQDNGFIRPSEVMILGEVDVEDLIEARSKLDLSRAQDMRKLHGLTATIDDRLSPVIETIVRAEKIPIVIGGGHNNCYGILKGFYQARKQPIHALNLDPHADFRALEGRHSGNGFSYAWEHGYLEDYYIIGLHEAYNNRTILEALRERSMGFTTFEEIEIRKEISLETAIEKGFSKLKKEPVGIELDTDSILSFPASAFTSTGFSSSDARRYAYLCGTYDQSAYLHVCEAAPSLLSDGFKIAGKILTGIVMDFIKGKRTTLSRS